jgi:hypothetical protein
MFGNTSVYWLNIGKCQHWEWRYCEYDNYLAISNGLLGHYRLKNKKILLYFSGWEKAGFPIRARTQFSSPFQSGR